MKFFPTKIDARIAARNLGLLDPWFASSPRGWYISNEYGEPIEAINPEGRE